MEIQLSHQFRIFLILLFHLIVHNQVFCSDQQQRQPTGSVGCYYKIIPLKSTVTFRSGLLWRLLISFLFSVSPLQRLNSLCSTLLDYSYFVLPIGFGLYFLGFSYPHLLAAAASGRLLPKPWLWVPFFLDTICIIGLSEMILITSTCKSSFSSALRGLCSSLEGYSCLPRRDKILTFFQNFGT